MKQLQITSVRPSRTVVGLFLYLIFCITCCFAQQDLSQTTINKAQPLNVRVLLEEKNSGLQNIFIIDSCKSKLLIQSPDAQQKVELKEDQNLEIIVKDNNLYLTLFNEETNLPEIKKIRPKQIEIIPFDGLFKVNGKPYQGILTFKIDEKNETLLVINTLFLDDYLYSVLLSESFQSWPMEVQKVQVVAFRSYAINCILKARQNNGSCKPYDIKRTNFHQTYNGMHNYIHLKEAITQTNDLILTHNSNVILAMFDACCGGVIPAKMNGIEFKKAPYLARRYACTFCKNYRLYQWHREIDIQDFRKKLKNNLKISQKIHDVGKILNIRIKEKDNAGIIHKIKLFGSRKNVTICGNDLWESMRDKIKSLNFNIKKRRDRIIIDGKGFGHQIGLCQHGARELVRLGWNFRRILKYYYPGTKFAKLNYAKI